MCVFFSFRACNSYINPKGSKLIDVVFLAGWVQAAPAIAMLTCHVSVPHCCGTLFPEAITEAVCARVILLLYNEYSGTITRAHTTSAAALASRHAGGHTVCMCRAATPLPTSYLVSCLNFKQYGSGNRSKQKAH